MRLRVALLQALLVLPAAGCTHTADTTLADAAGATLTGVLDSPITLVDGRYEGTPYQPSAASRPVVRLADDLSLVADVDGDGRSEAVVVVVASPGGSGTYLFLAVIESAGGSARSIATAALGDRVRVESLSVADGVISAGMLVHGPADALCCPTIRRVRKWTLDGATLEESGDVAPFDGEPDRPNRQGRKTPMPAGAGPATVLWATMGSLTRRGTRVMFRTTIVRLPAAMFLLAVMAGPARAATEYLYVANNHDGTVSVVAVPEFEVVDVIDVLPDQPLRAAGGTTYADDVALSADGSRLYVSRGGMRDVAAFSLPGGDLLWRVATDGLADHFALSPDGRALFVSVYSEDRVHVIDTTEGQELARIDSCSGPHGMRFSADGRHVYNGCMIGDALDVLDATSFERIGRISFAEGVRPFEISADERKAWVQLTRLHGLVEVDLESGRVTKTIHLPVPPGVTAQEDFPHTAHHGLALSPDGSRLCAAGTVADYVAVLSVPALDLLATVPVGTEPSWAVASRDGRYCFVSSRKSDTVSVIAFDDGRELARIDVGAYPQRMWVVARNESGTR